MTDTTGSREPQRPTTAAPRRRGELTAWWLVFGALVVAIAGMLGAWN